MLFQISCYDLSWNEAKNLIKDLLSYPLNSYPSDIMLKIGWNGILNEKTNLESCFDDEQSGFFKKLIKIAEMDKEFALGHKKIDSESSIFILSFLKSLFKKTLSLIRALGKVPKAVTLSKNLIVQENPIESKNQDEHNEASQENKRKNNRLESEDNLKVSEKANDVDYEKDIHLGLEILYYDEIRGPVSLVICGIELDQSVRHSIKNLMDQKSGTITLLMDDWVMVNEIKEYIPNDISESHPRMFQLLVYWKNSDFPFLYENITPIEIKVSSFLQEIFQNPNIEIQNLLQLKNEGSDVLRPVLVDFLKNLSKCEVVAPKIHEDSIINTEDLQQEPSHKEIRGAGQRSKLESMEITHQTKFDRKLRQEINELNKIINQGILSDEEKILIRVLDVVSALNYNSQKKGN